MSGETRNGVDVGNTLDSLRRTHIVLAVASVGVLLLAIPTGPDFQAGLAQLRSVGEMFGAGGYAQRCADLAGGQYALQWSSARTFEGTTPTAEIPPGARFGGFAICRVPSSAASLEAALDFLSTGERVTFASFVPADLHEVLGQEGAGDAPLLRAMITHPASPPIVEVSVVVGSDTLDISVVQPGWNSEGLVDPLTLHVERGVPTSFSILKAPMSGELATLTRTETPLDWLLQTQPGSNALADSARGELVVLQHLQPFWPEVRAFSLSEATRYLQARADDQQGSVEVFGMNVEATMIVWGGPLLVLALLGYMLAHILHLNRLAIDNAGALGGYPWVGLFPDSVSMLIRLTSIVVLPIAACGAVVVRAWPTVPLATAWAALAMLSGLIVAVKILSLLGRLRA